MEKRQNCLEIPLSSKHLQTNKIDTGDLKVEVDYENKIINVTGDGA